MHFAFKTRDGTVISGPFEMAAIRDYYEAASTGEYVQDEFGGTIPRIHQL